ncbi:14740_t:CDS:1 [Acaulospora morrowiae]|uniref:14740_t:CDS:1 n=1 Tax=Acaulospora morrowiae TaxID=94023 RepID=A0A9N9FUL1_9GLOM|nr:14740_t:CDS:1 [Acaulospora morrowiae]
MNDGMSASQSSNTNNNMRQLEIFKNEDWDHLISQNSCEAYSYLFIILWDSTGLSQHKALVFDDQMERMIHLVGKLYRRKVINFDYKDTIIWSLHDYRRHRLSNQRNKRNRLVEFSWDRLESYGLKNQENFQKQLEKLKLDDNIKLRNIVLERMARLIKGPNENKVSDELREEIESLKSQVLDLQKENSQYQATLGSLTSVNLNDDDPNNAVQIARSIRTLQYSLGDLAMVKGPDYEINQEKCAELLGHYKCSATPEERLVLSGAIQRLVLDTIFEETNGYFREVEQHLKNSPSDCSVEDTVEVDLFVTSERLAAVTENFDKLRPGKDLMASVAPTKIRQQINAILGSRAFSNDSNRLIMKISKIIVEKLNHHRKILDDELKNDEEGDIVQLIRDIIQLFYFRFKAQPKMIEWKFYENGDSVDPSFMQSLKGFKDLKKQKVEICSFPAIFICEDDEVKKVISKAQIIAAYRDFS